MLNEIVSAKKGDIEASKVAPPSDRIIRATEYSEALDILGKSMLSIGENVINNHNTNQKLRAREMFREIASKKLSKDQFTKEMESVKRKWIDKITSNDERMSMLDVYNGELQEGYNRIQNNQGEENNLYAQQNAYSSLSLLNDLYTERALLKDGSLDAKRKDLEIADTERIYRNALNTEYIRTDGTISRAFNPIERIQQQENFIGIKSSALQNAELRRIDGLTYTMLGDKDVKSIQEEKIKMLANYINSDDETLAKRFNFYTVNGRINKPAIEAFRQQQMKNISLIENGGSLNVTESFNNQIKLEKVKTYIEQSKLDSQKTGFIAKDIVTSFSSTIAKNGEIYRQAMEEKNTWLMAKIEEDTMNYLVEVSRNEKNLVGYVSADSISGVFGINRFIANDTNYYALTRNLLMPDYPEDFLAKLSDDERKEILYGRAEKKKLSDLENKLNAKAKEVQEYEFYKKKEKEEREMKRKAELERNPPIKKMTVNGRTIIKNGNRTTEGE